MALLVDADLAPSNSGSWPTHSDVYGKGGFRSVADNTARDAIATPRRVVGMWVYSRASATLYTLGAGLTNADWTAVSLGSTGTTLVDFKDSVRVATTANITLSAAQTIDGVSVIAGDRVLVKNQTTGAENGLYVCAAGAWTRATDADATAEVTSGLCVPVEVGTANAGKLFLLTTANPITLGATTLTFSAISGAGVTAGNGLTGTTTLAVLPLDSSITVAAGGVSRAALTGDVTAAAGSNTTAIAAGVIVDADVNASAAIAHTKLATIATDRLLGRDTTGTGTLEVLTVGGGIEFTGSGGLQRSALTGDITSAAGSGTTAIAAGVIVDADVNASAAIATTKIAAGFVRTDGTAALAGSWSLGTQTLTAAHSISYTLVDDGNSSTADTINWSSGGNHKSTLTGNCTFTFTAPTTTEVGLQLRLVQDATGSRTVTWPGTVVWPGSVAPTLSTTAGAVDIISFWYDGTSYHGFSGSGGSATIADNAVTMAKLADLATDRLIGRDTTGTGDPEALTVGGGIEFTGSGGLQRSALTGDITATAGSNTTAIAAGVIVDADVNASAAIAHTKLATIATDSLLGRDTAGTGAIETISLNATLEMSGAGALQRAALTGDITATAGSNTTAIAAGVIVNADVNASAAIAVTKLAPGTALQQIRTNSAGTALEHFSPPSPVVGTDLTNASVTRNISDGSQFTLPASTLATSAKTVTLGTTGSPEVGEIVEFIIYSQSQNFVLSNGGPLADILYTVIAGTKRVLHARWDGADWRGAGKIRLT